MRCGIFVWPPMFHSWSFNSCYVFVSVQQGAAIIALLVIGLQNIRLKTYRTATKEPNPERSRILWSLNFTVKLETWKTS